MATTKRLSAATRKKSATVHTKAGAAKFPENDKKHARLAIQLEDTAKPPLTPPQRHAVEARAATFGIGPLAAKKSVQHAKSTKKGSK